MEAQTESFPEVRRKAASILGAASGRRFGRKKIAGPNLRDPTLRN